MAISFGTTSAADPNPLAPEDARVPAGAGQLQLFVFALFFIFGGITSLNDVLIPKLKLLFTLSYVEVMLIQSAFFAAYFLISFPAARIVGRFGYMRAAAIGLGVMTVGCLLFVPAANFAAFPAFLLALFVLASGITIVQVVSNPLISLLGPPATASSRLTFAQAFNSLGTTIFPYVGAIVILGSLASVDPAKLTGTALDVFRSDASRAVVHAYVGIAVALLVIAAAVLSRRRALPHVRAPAMRLSTAATLLRRPRFAFGTLGIFLYVGAEVAIGSLLVSYLTSPGTLGLSQSAAGKHLAFYWGGAMVGRFIAAGLLRMFAPGKVLAAAAAVVLALLFTSASSVGSVSGWTLLAVGLFNSLMFPTIFSLASEGLGERAAEGSGIICMAIVGGAIIPLLTGALADATSLKTALIVPAFCYVAIAAFGLFAARKPVTDHV